MFAVVSSDEALDAYKAAMGQPDKLKAVTDEWKNRGSGGNGCCPRCQDKVASSVRAAEAKEFLATRCDWYFVELPCALREKIKAATDQNKDEVAKEVADLSTALCEDIDFYADIALETRCKYI